ncbi:hypothetical protein FE236_12015 [Mariprofundus erugo]|uniref:intermembrane phospholipid transport protein YdbH family protein n=1 Tax=Mariprofundus erugo TaxID=2528639 RepID=UPI0010FF1A55|nr:YdbH domain-containing protein [Mariprofundus erugo]TLS74043.1 hypothetical protein FE236_12015 [Mariprofundus erugo]
MKVVLRVSTLLLLAAMMMVAATYHFLPQIVSAVLSSRLAAAGYAKHQITISDIGWHKAVLESFRLDADDASFHLELRNIAIEYALNELIHGRIRSIEVASLQASVKSAPPAKESTPVPLPVATFALIPAQRVLIRQMSVVLPEGSPLQSLSGSIDYQSGVLHAPMLLSSPLGLMHVRAEVGQDGHVDVALNPQVAGSKASEMLSLAGTVSRQPHQLQFGGRVHADAAALWQLSARGDLNAASVAGRIDADVNFSLPDQLPSTADAFFSALIARVHLLVDLSAVPQGALKQVTGRGGLSVECRDAGCDWHLDGGGAFQASLAAATSPIVLSWPSGFAGRVDIADRGLTLILPARQSVRLGKFSVGSAALPETVLGLDAPLRLSYRDGVWHPQAVALAVSPQSLQLAGMPVTHAGAKVALQPAAGGGINAALHVTGVNAAVPGMQPFPFDLSGTLALDQANMTANATLATQDGMVQLNGRVVQQRATGDGAGTWSVPAIAFSREHPLSRLLDLKKAFDVDGGVLALTGSSHWQQHDGRYVVSHHVEIDLKGGSGVVGDGLFDGLSTRMVLDGEGGLRSKPARIEMASFNNGVPIRDLSVNLVLKLPLSGDRKPALYLSDFSASLLGGKVSSPEMVFDFNRSGSSFPVLLEHVDIEQILALERHEGLYGNGFLDGSIPLTWSPAGVSVSGGKLAARSPGGKIRYIADNTTRALAESNMSMNIVLGIISDFHYHQMDVAMDYAADGRLLMQVHLAGNNPAYANGRAVEFNLNLEENVLRLLESLRVAGDISRKVDERLQKRMKK